MLFQKAHYLFFKSELKYDEPCDKKGNAGMIRTSLATIFIIGPPEAAIMLCGQMTLKNSHQIHQPEYQNVCTVFS